MSSLFGLDRWGRPVTDRIGSLQDLSETSIGFASVTEGLDLSTPSGRVSWIALRVHRVRTGPLRERVRAGIAAAKKPGKPFGRPATPERCRKNRASLCRGREISAKSRNGSVSFRSSVLRANPQRESAMARGGLSLAVILRLNLAGSKGPAMRPLLSEKCLSTVFITPQCLCLVLFVEAH